MSGLAGDMSILSAAVVAAVILIVAATVYAAIGFLQRAVDKAPPSARATERAMWFAARRGSGQRREAAASH